MTPFIAAHNEARGVQGLCTTRSPFPVILPNREKHSWNRTRYLESFATDKSSHSRGNPHGPRHCKQDMTKATDERVV